MIKAMLGDWRSAFEEYWAALARLEQLAGPARARDPEGYVVCRAHVLETASLAHWDHAQSLEQELNPDLPEEQRATLQKMAMDEYYRACLLAVREIELLRDEAVRESDNQVYAHINAGDYLEALNAYPESQVPQALEKALWHWQKARSLATRLGLNALSKEAGNRISKYRISTGVNQPA
jgi:hypothetical protein